MAEDMRRIIICDFDETITDRDTIGILGQLPYAVKPGFEPKWSHFTDTYMENYRKFLEDPVLLECDHNLGRRLPLLPSNDGDITRSNFQCLFKDEIRYQTDARNLEISSTSEMAKYGLFAGLTHSQVSHFVKEKMREHSFSLRNGFRDFMSSISAPQFFIVSVNWSAEFIRGAVGEELVDFDNICCNQLVSNGDTFTGQFSNQLLTGSDKVSFIEKIFKEQCCRDIEQQYWYIGDSETDILALLHPEVNGVLLIDPELKEQKFRKLTTEVLGIDESLVNRFISSKEVGWLRCYVKNQENSLYLAKSWFDLTNINTNTD
ncbi:hypothetical protein HG536_0G03420 [Torulaspora globosa]|uniref:Uncharacterized protein n=1 Tax=Torulaspora globosa TaxID=48254 RepID=A0A7G3ZLU4_9SACH|nr:uncharacterized protein HG536_0G03420 [Torulaspora globosa]QLL34480.1 hypothetical protein HG536_0G03420 [Torulaspora globosa]